MTYSRVLAALLAVFALVLNVRAAEREIKVEGGVAYVIPANSSFSFAGLEEPFGSARFTGPLTIRGTYYYGRLAGFPGDEAIGLFFLPDEGDAAGLPYWRYGGRVREIKFENPRAFIAAVIPKRFARAVEQGRRNSVRGRVTLNIDGFEATVICGGAIYLTRFRSVAHKPVLLADKGAQPRTTC